MSYRFIKKDETLTLETFDRDFPKKTVYRVTIKDKKGHIHVKISGPNFKKQGLTNVHNELNLFERKALTFFLLKKALAGNSINNVNYSQVFISCFGQ